MSASGHVFNSGYFFPVDTRRHFNVYTTSYRRWNDVVCLLGLIIIWNDLFKYVWLIYRLRRDKKRDLKTAVICLIFCRYIYIKPERV